MRRTLRMIDYLTHNFIYNQRHCFLMDVIVKMMVSLLHDDISQFPASCFFFLYVQKRTASDRAMALPGCSSPCFYLNSNMHSSCISKQVQGSGCQALSRQEVHVYLTDCAMLLIEDDMSRQ